MKSYSMPVLAEQYDGTIKSAGIIMEWTNWDAKASNGDLVLKGTVISKDYWVVRTTDGEFYVHDPITFTATFEPVE